MYLEEKSFVEETYPHSPDTSTYILVLTLSGSYTLFEVPSFLLTTLLFFSLSPSLSLNLRVDCSLF